MPAVLEKRPTGSELASMAWQSLRQAFGAMPLFYSGALLTYGAAVAFDSIAAYPPAARALLPSVLLSYPAFPHLVTATRGVVALGLIAMAAVATHRFILLGDASPKFSWKVLQFSLWLLLVVAMLLLLDLVKGGVKTALPDGGVSVLIAAAVWIAQVVVAFHFVLIFPSIAVGETFTGWGDRAEIGWARMGGNFWLFLTADLAALLPIIIALVAIALMSLLIVNGLGPEGSLSAISIWSLVVEVIRDLLSFPVLMVQAAIASWLYAWVRQEPGPVAVPAVGES